MAASLAAAVYLRGVLTGWRTWNEPFAFLLPAVFLSAWVGGTQAGLIATAAAGTIGIGMFTPPEGSTDLDCIIQVLLFLAEGVATVAVCAVAHRAIARAHADHDAASRNFEIMANNAPVLIWCTDAAGRCIFVNRNWLAFTGQPAAERLAGRRPGQIHPGDALRYESISGRAIAAHEPFKIEYRLRAAEGGYRWLLEQAVPRFGRDGGFEGYIGSCSDISDSHQEREELAFLARAQGALGESLDLDKCADALAQSFLPRFADWCSIELVNEAGELERVRVQHIDHGIVTSPLVSGAEAAAFAVRIARCGAPLMLRTSDDALLRLLAYGESHYQRLRSIGAVSYIGVPLRLRGNIIGVLAFATAESGRVLGSEELRLVQKVAGLASFALDNARLYRRTRQALAAEENARRELERSERRFRFMWDANMFGLGTVAPDGRILTANTALAELLRYAPDEIEAGRASLHDRTPPAWRSADERARLELKETGRFAPFEKDFIRPDGSTVQALVGGCLLPDSDECMAYVLDLTPRKHAERALDRQRMLLKTIIDAMPAMVGYLGPDERFWLHNERCRAWLGAGAASLDGWTLRDCVGEETYERMAPYLRAALRGRTMSQEFTLRSTVRERHLIANYRPDLDADGNVCGIVIHAYDITERKEMEQALAEALLRYRFLADAMPQMVWTALPDGQLDYINHRWLETTGLSETVSLTPDGWLAAAHPDDRDAAHELWRCAVESHEPFELECRLRCGRTGEPDWRWHLVRALPRRDDTGRLVQWVGSATDVDEQRRAYAELAEARERLKSHAEELEERVRARTATLREANAELEAFTYSVSHDLRTPLQFIRGFAEAIRDDARTTPSSEHRDYLERIIRAATRMDSIIQDLLAYSRLSRAEMQRVDVPLEEVISEVLGHHHGTIRQTHAEIIVDRPLPIVRGDRTGLFQALANLISNALKFARHGERPMVHIRAEATEHTVRLWIEDNGIGIDPRHHERIFQLFERLHGASEYPGTGIGLSLVRKAVTRMGGACGVESTPGRGSRFWIDFAQPVPMAAVTHAAA